MGASVWKKLKLAKIQYAKADCCLALVINYMEAKLNELMVPRSSLSPWAAVIILMSLPLVRVLGQEI